MSASTSRARRAAERGGVTAGRRSRAATSRSCRRRRDTNLGRSSKSLVTTKTQGVAAFRWERSPDSSIRANPRRGRWTFAAARGRRRPARRARSASARSPKPSSRKNWPPDMSGARGGDVVLMSGNLWLKLSVDGGKTFTDLDFTKIFAAGHRLRRLGRRPGHPLHSGDRLLRSVCSVVQRYGHAGEPQCREDRAREPGRSQEILGRQAGVVAAMGLHAGYVRARHVMDGFSRPDLRQGFPARQHQRLRRQDRQAVLRTAARRHGRGEGLELPVRFHRRCEHPHWLACTERDRQRVLLGAARRQLAHAHLLFGRRRPELRVARARSAELAARR